MKFYRGILSLFSLSRWSSLLLYPLPDRLEMQSLLSSQIQGWFLQLIIINQSSTEPRFVQHMTILGEVLIGCIGYQCAVILSAKQLRRITVEFPEICLWHQEGASANMREIILFLAFSSCSVETLNAKCVGFLFTKCSYIPWLSKIHQKICASSASVSREDHCHPRPLQRVVHRFGRTRDIQFITVKMELTL